MASSSSGASSSTTTPSPSSGFKKQMSSMDKLPSTAKLIANKENDLTSSNEVDTEDDLNSHFSTSLSSAWVDDIRFSSYRLAAKLRLLQQRTGLVLLDVWNVIEAFREQGLNNADPEMSISKAKLEALLSSMYGALAKRLPPPSQSSSSGSNPVASPNDLKAMASWLFNWLFNALKPAGSSNMKVRTLKTAMSTLCSGKLLDKLRYLFSQLTDVNGHMMPERFAAFLRDVARISSAVGEERQHQDENPDSIFHEYGDKPITVNDFIETLMSDPGPASLSWLPLLHRIANAETVMHYGLRCSSCRAENFRGLKYKSDRSPNYQLCQACFWRGHISGEHKNDVFKEYNSHKPSSGIGGGYSRSTTPSSLKKSMSCLQGPNSASASSATASAAANNITNVSGGKKSKKKQQPEIPKFPEHPEKPMDLSNMMPPTSVSSGTLWSHPAGGNFLTSNNGTANRSSDRSSASMANASGSSNPIGEQHYFLPPQGQEIYDDPYMVYPEDEHQLIAAYAHQLANSPEMYSATTQGHAVNVGNGGTGGGHGKSQMDMHSRQLVRELERKNREIMRDIHQLKHAHRNRSQRIMQMPTGAASSDPTIVTELEDLRNHKADLEVRLDELQTARRDLMTELEELMKLLKVNNEMYAQDIPMGGEQPYYPTPMPRNNLPGGGGGPMVIVSSAGGIRHFEDVTDVSGLGIDRPRRPSSSMQRVGIIANEDSINSASD